MNRFPAFLLPIAMILAVVATACSDRLGDGIVTQNTYASDIGKGMTVGVRSPGALQPVAINAVGSVLTDPALLEGLASEEWRQAFDGVESLFTSDDLTIVDLFCPASPRGETTRLFEPYRCDPASLEAMAASGVDVVKLANERTLDFGPDALMDTIDRIEAAGMIPVGAGEDREASEAPAVITLDDGRTVAVIAMTVIPPPSYGDTAGGPTVFHELTGERLAEVVESVAATNDIVVVSVHGGDPDSQEPDFLTLGTSSIAITSGATIIVAEGAHRLHRYQIANGVPSATGLGDFVFPFTSDAAADTAIARFEIDDKGKALGCLIGATIAINGQPRLDHPGQQDCSFQATPAE